MKNRSDGWVRRAFSPGEDDARSFSERNQWAREGQRIDPDDRLWKQYLAMIDLYKYYLDAAWKAAIWYYAATGAALSFFFNKDEAERRMLSPVLIFILLISLGFAYLLWRGARNLSSVPRVLEYIACTLRLPGRPHVEFGVVFLILNAAMQIVIAVGSLVAFLYYLR
jgi:hypothetical protein